MITQGFCIVHKNLVLEFMSVKMAFFLQIILLLSTTAELPCYLEVRRKYYSYQSDLMIVDRKFTQLSNVI